MDEFRGHFLADAGFSVNQYGHVGFGGRREGFYALQEHGRASDHAHLLAGQVHGRCQTVNAFEHKPVAVRGFDRISLDAYTVGAVGVIVMGMHDLARVVVGQHRFVRAVFTILMTGYGGMVGYFVAAVSDDCIRLHAIGGAVGPIGGDDPVVLVDQYGG